MANLDCHDSVSRWKNEQVSQYPELKIFIEKLESMVKEKPDKGKYAPIFSDSGKVYPCYKHSVNISLFSPMYAVIGYNFITAHYIYHKNKTAVYIMRMNFS